MRARYKGPKKSMGYKPGRSYVLATTFTQGFFWIADINDSGAPVPYGSVKSFLEYWEVEEMPNQNAELGVWAVVNND